MAQNSIVAKLFSSAIATTIVGFAGQVQALSFTGASSGRWGMPANPSASTILSNQNRGINNRLSWGRNDCFDCTPFNNYVQYDGTSFDADVGSLFNLGNLSYRNGSTWNNFDGDFSLNIALSFTNPVNSTNIFNFSFNILNTINATGNSIVDGDRLRFSTAGISSQSFNYNGVDYTLQLVGFSSNSGQTIVSDFNSPEGNTAQASLYGKITSVNSPPPTQTDASNPRDTTAIDTRRVPEPASVAGLLLLGVFFAAGRRN